MCELKMAGQGISYAVPIHVMRWHVLGCLSPQGRLVHADHDGAPESHDYVGPPTFVGGGEMKLDYLRHAMAALHEIVEQHF